MNCENTSSTDRMPNIRIIPRLEIKGPNLVKGIQFEGLRVLGKPESFANQYYKMGADELIFVDVTASLYGQNSLLQLIEQTSKQVFIPLTVGGGLRSLHDIRNVLNAGADKVCINTAATLKPSFIQEASNAFGASTVMVAIDARKNSKDRWEVFVEHGRESTGLDAIEWATEVSELGAGEIVITSINRDGTGKGYDVELISKIAKGVHIPVIAGGGAGKLEHILEVVKKGHINGVALASMLHYNLVRTNRVDEADLEQGNTEFLTGRPEWSAPSAINDLTLPEIKKYLRENLISCRNEL